MFGRIGNSLTNRRFGISTIVFTALLFLLAGFIVSARFNTIGSAAAESPALQRRFRQNRSWKVLLLRLRRN